MLCQDMSEMPKLKEIMMCADLKTNEINELFGESGDFLESKQNLFMDTIEGPDGFKERKGFMNLRQIATFAHFKNYRTELSALLKPFQDSLIKLDNNTVILNETLHDIFVKYFKNKLDFDVMGKVITLWMGHDSEYLKSTSLATLLKHSNLELEEFLKISFGSSLEIINGLDLAFRPLNTCIGSYDIKGKTFGEIKKSCKLENNRFLHLFPKIPDNFKFNSISEITNSSLKDLSPISLSLMVNRKKFEVNKILNKEPVIKLIAQQRTWKMRNVSDDLTDDNKFEKMTLCRIGSALTEISVELFHSLENECNTTVQHLLQRFNKSLNLKKLKVIRLRTYLELAKARNESEVSAEIDHDLYQATLLKMNDLLPPYGLTINDKLEIRSTTSEEKNRKMINTLEDLVNELFGIDEAQFLDILKIKAPGSLLQNYTFPALFHLSLTKTPAVYPSDVTLRDLVMNLVSIDKEFAVYLWTPIKDLMSSYGVIGKRSGADLKTPVLNKVDEFLREQYVDARVSKSTYLEHFKKSSMEALMEIELILVMQRIHSGEYLFSFSIQYDSHSYVTGFDTNIDQVDLILSEEMDFLDQ